MALQLARRSSRRSARRVIGAALLALLLAQWLALAHAVLHTARASLAFADAASVQADFLGHAAGAPECRLVDQLLSAAGTPDVSAPAGAPPPDVPVAAPGHAPVGPGPARPYEARAPPRA